MYRNKYGQGRQRRHSLPGRIREREAKRYKSRCVWYGPERRRKHAWERDAKFIQNLFDKWEKQRGREREDETEPEEEVVPPLPKEQVEAKLHVLGIDLHIEDNATQHHTEMYECTEDRTGSDGTKKTAELVIRRGQEFKMTVAFDRKYDIKKNDITLTFALGEDLKPDKCLNVSFKVDETGKCTDYKPTKWGATVIGQKDCSLALSVFCPASTPVGEWQLSVRTIVDVDGEGKDLIWQYNHCDDINILFNPWCKEDLVYLEDKDWLKEAVLSDSGCIYMGSSWDPGVRSWNFGQFDDGILEAAMHLMRKCFDFKASAGMGNPVLVTRRISAVVNGNDDDGVLTGNWSGHYEGGTSPTKWTGCVKILRQYMKHAKPVKYGQCWVFSAVTTTVCRALGIPCRSVTNFDSAHNTDKDRLSIDSVMRKINDEWECTRIDSVWNFHVWNDVWMQRPDLCNDHKWDGWQAIDGTPQERSDGVFCCGPAPVKAIKEGEITCGQDAPFIFSEVNGDQVTWQEDPDTGDYKEIHRNPWSVGSLIATHAATGKGFVISDEEISEKEKLKKELLDLTQDYKYRDDTTKEREIVKKAERVFRIMNGTTIAGDFEEEPEPVATLPPIKVEIERPVDVFVGSSFDFKVHVTNTGTVTCAIKDIVVTVSHKTYSDNNLGTAERKKFKDYYLDGGKKETFNIHLDEKTASAHPESGFNFEANVVVSFDNVPEIIEEKKIFRLRRPDMKVKGPPKCKLSDTINVVISYNNPLKVALTECELEVEGGLTSQQLKDRMMTIPNIGPLKTWSTTLKMKPIHHPRGQKHRTISLGFESKQLQEICGSYRVEIV